MIKIILGLGLRWGQQPWRSNNANSRDPSSSTMKSSRVSRTAPPLAYRAIVNFAHLLHTVVKMNGGLGYEPRELWYRQNHLPTSLLEPSAACVTQPSSKAALAGKGVMKMETGWKSGQFSGSIRCWVGRPVSEVEGPWANSDLPRNLCRDQRVTHSRAIH